MGAYLKPDRDFSFFTDHDVDFKSRGRYSIYGLPRKLLPYADNILPALFGFVNTSIAKLMLLRDTWAKSFCICSGYAIKYIA